MARPRIKIDRKAIQKLMKNTDLVADRVKAIEEACNGESSWGGYASSVSTDSVRARGTVWSYASQDGRGNTERANRMIRNLDAGS